MYSVKKAEVHDIYYPDEGRPLTDAIFEAIEAARGEDMRDANFQLNDDIDPDALDRLFRDDATGRTTVQFTTDDVQVKLRANGVINIWVKSK